MTSCCPHPVERHAYNGCAECGCGVPWTEHPDRDYDTSEAGLEQNRMYREQLQAEVKSYQEEVGRLRARAEAAEEKLDYMRNRYSMFGGRGCALCVYEDGKFIRPCKLHEYVDASATRADEMEAKVDEARAAHKQPPFYREMWQALVHECQVLDQYDLQAAALKFIAHAHDMKPVYAAAVDYVEGDGTTDDIFEAVEALAHKLILNKAT